MLLPPLLIDCSGSSLSFQTFTIYVFYYLFRVRTGSLLPRFGKAKKTSVKGRVLFKDGADETIPWLQDQ
jgi:hypothetical protein